MKLFKWIEGRQGTTIQYWKYCFLYWKIGRWGFDGYKLKYSKGTYIPPHKDPVENGKHYRLNITLKGVSRFWCPVEIWKLGERIHLFRPDVFPHSLTIYSDTVKLSIGIVKFDKK